MAMAGRGGLRSTSFKKGQVNNPKGRPKAIIHLQELARAETEASIKTLVEIRDMVLAPPAARVGAANALLDRGWGKPAQTTTITMNDKRSVQEWTDDELIAFLKRATSRSRSNCFVKKSKSEPDSVH
jgi:hypothetical protein